MDLFDFVCLLRRLHLCGRVSHPSSFYSCSHVPSCLSPSTISCLPGPPGLTPALPTLKWRPAGDNSRSTKWDSVGQSLDEGRYSPPPSGFALAALSSSSASSLLYRSSVCGIHETTSYNGRRARGREELQGDPSGWLKPPVDLDLGCSAILPGQQVATVLAHLLPELSELVNGRF